MHNREKDREQLAAFRKAAREAGVADNEEQFQNALRTVARAKPSEEKRQSGRAKDKSAKQDQE